MDLISRREFDKKNYESSLGFSMHCISCVDGSGIDGLIVIDDFNIRTI